MPMNKAVPSKLIRNKFRMSIKEQAVQRADRDGVPKAAADFGIPESTLDEWREKRRMVDEVTLLELSASCFPNKRWLSH
jgi:hypothetical protein